MFFLGACILKGRLEYELLKYVLNFLFLRLHLHLFPSVTLFFFIIPSLLFQFFIYIIWQDSVLWTYALYSRVLKLTNFKVRYDFWHHSKSGVDFFFYPDYFFFFFSRRAHKYAHSFAAPFSQSFLIRVSWSLIMINIWHIITLYRVKKYFPPPPLPPPPRKTLSFSGGQKLRKLRFPSMFRCVSSVAKCRRCWWNSSHSAFPFTPFFFKKIQH